MDTATNGLDAVLAAVSNLPDVIVMDVNLPVLDGIEGWCNNVCV